MSDFEVLRNRFVDAHAAPVLFLGAGFSRRYSDSPGWKDLLSVFSAALGQDISFYFSRANGSLPKTASLIAEDFHTLWFTNDAYRASREQYSESCCTVADPLKYEIAQYLKQFANPTNNQTELKSLLDVTFESIITTNFDEILERLFPNYVVYRAQDQLIQSVNYGTGEIYKIHGCVSEPSSMILTESDYVQFEERNVILIAKLLVTIIEHPLVIMGYSLSDKNIQSVLQNIIDCLNSKNLDLLSKNLFFVEWTDGATLTLSNATMKFGEVVLPFTKIECSSFDDIFLAMQSFKRRFPSSLIRALKKQVYELVESADPQSRLAVVNIEDEASLERAEFVVGVGLTTTDTGYVGLGRDDIYQAVLAENTNLDANQVLTKVVPGLVQGNSQCPIFRFLREAGRIDGHRLNLANLGDDIGRRANGGSKQYIHSSYVTAAREINEKYESLDALLHDMEPKQAVYRIALLEESKIDLVTLHGFLVDTRDLFIELSGGHISNWRKLVCFYDALRFGPKHAG